MKCSRCYKTIPSGEEILKDNQVFGAWWWSKEVLCSKCAKIRDKQKKIYLIIAISFIALYLLFFFFSFFKIWGKINKMIKDM